MDKKEYSDTLKAAQYYVNCLYDLHQKAVGALRQIEETSKDSEEQIKETFSSLLDHITKLLSDRQDTLIRRVHEIRNQSLKPLEQCTKIIQENFNSTNSLLNSDADVHQIDIEDFNKRASLLGCLPEVPELKDVPCINFYYEKDVENQLEKIISSFGDIVKIAPVQIQKISERPGALLIEWQLVDNEDKFKDVQEFILEKASGSSTHKGQFVPCYKGLETEYLVKELNMNQLYTFRVCCKFEGDSDYTFWSVPQNAKTTIKHFSWKPTEMYSLSNENKIANSCSDDTCIFISDGPQVELGYSVEFTILELGQDSAIIGLIPCHQNNLKTLRGVEKSFLIYSTGEIEVNGVKKSTQLPTIKANTKVCFTSEYVNQKTMIHVDIYDKRVTYEWHVEKENFYFGAQVSSKNWKILVE